MLRDARVALGDMYELIREIEVTLHKMIKAVLVLELGPNWWLEGIPAKIRAECAQRLELDYEPAEEPYCYTTLLQLGERLDKQWNVFRRHLPRKVVSDKKRLLSHLEKLNGIRNRVMHPVRGGTLSEGDFAFVREFAVSLQLEEWDKALRAISVGEIES